MTDEDSYPPEWGDHEPPDYYDPRLGTALDPWHPDAAQRARVAGLAHQYVSRDHTFYIGFLGFCSDNYNAKTWPQALLALLEQFAQTAIGAQGEQLAVARLAGDVEHAREDVLREAAR